MCFDDQIKIKGDYNSEKAQRLQIVFERCNNETIVPKNSCHTDKNITAFLRRKFIFVVQNVIRFKSSEYGETST